MYLNNDVMYISSNLNIPNKLKVRYTRELEVFPCFKGPKFSTYSY